MLNSAQQDLYVALLLELSRSLFDALWDSERDKLPEKYLTEVEPELWAVRKDLGDVLPDRDAVFNTTGYTSNYYPTLDILLRLDICRKLTDRTYAFEIDFSGVEASVRALEAWNIVSLSEVAGAYFSRRESMLDLEPVRHSNERHDVILRRFCAAGFAHETPSGFFWTCEEIDNVFEHRRYYWRGAEDAAGNRY